jgi:pimeloyl-ACP methyl ester carboxylesterase
LKILKRIFFAIVIIIGLILITGSIILQRFIYTDSELAEHYENKKTIPQYKFTEIAGRQIHYAVVEKSENLPLLLLVHGAPGAWYGFLNLIDDSLLQQHFKIISIDRPGYGKSGYGLPELSTHMQAIALKKVIDVENKRHQKVILLGRSYGAPIAASCAINNPKDISKLFMVSPVIDPDRERFYWFSTIGRWKFTKWLLPQMMNVATEEKYTHAEQMETLKDKWKNLYVPTYVIVGEKDVIADTANFTFSKKYIVNCKATFLKLKGTSHLVTSEQEYLIKKLLINAKDEIK